MDLLKGSRLKVGYEVPGDGYRGTRFDWSTGVVSIELDGRHAFASSEYTEDDADYLAGGRGLFCEFGIHAPVAYDEVPVGGWFPKIGVGLLRRESEAPYDFFHNYAEIRRQTYAVERRGDAELRIESSMESSSGYGWRLSRVWKVGGCSLSCASELENLGDLPIETDEYCHNFVRLGPAPVGPDYRMDFSFPLPETAAEAADPSSCLAGARPEFVRVPEADFYLGGLMPSPTEKPWWRLRDVRSGLSMTERLSGAGLRCALWGRSHVISPELFIGISVGPGGRQAWERTWEFDS